MKVVILCGGKGSRLSLEQNIPKPLALVHGKPILWHIMKTYMHYGFNEFILPLGFGGDKIKEYFYNYEWKNYNFIKDNSSIRLLQKSEDWKISFIDTGIDTMTGGRIKKIQPYIEEDTFMLTYGDGLSDINMDNLLKFHYKKGKIATVTGIKRQSQYGILTLKDGIAESFDEKSSLDGIINGGYFVLNKKIFNYIDNKDNCVFEQEPLKALVKESQLAVYMHNGFWASIDTQKDLITANEVFNPAFL